MVEEPKETVILVHGTFAAPRRGKTKGTSRVTMLPLMALSLGSTPPSNAGAQRLAVGRTVAVKTVVSIGLARIVGSPVRMRLPRWRLT